MRRFLRAELTAVLSASRRFEDGLAKRATFALKYKHDPLDSFKSGTFRSRVRW